MVSNSSILKHSADIRFRRVGEEAIVIHQKNTEVLALNEVGCRVLELLDGEISLTRVADRRTAEYDVAAAKLQEDVLAFAEELLEAGLIEVTPQSVERSSDGVA